ncbi:lysozyme [Mesorhizobium neociceri]|uniref:Lysozyme n=1 Tax=Mesorhizobium neociceri TaxID=1307853 RepID=A0A838B4J4_9HYPH|nr:lysozyme [Mesorhizobium neociceri]MBA1141768.1 lysozyme [Mesorhizobium neociceri]
MPINKIRATARGRAAIVAVMVAAISGAWGAWISTHPTITPAAIHQAIDEGITPPAVQLAIDRLIIPWEGLRLVAYRDSVGVWTICYGETLGVYQGMRATLPECKEKLVRRVINDFYLPLVDGVKDYVIAPDSVQASMISGAYNFGAPGQKKSRTARFVTAHQYRQACEAQTAWNKAGGAVLPGLVKRREMGDAQRLGEAELCVSGLN